MAVPPHREHLGVLPKRVQQGRRSGTASTGYDERVVDKAAQQSVSVHSAF